MIPILHLPLLAKFPEQICYHCTGIQKNTIHWLLPVFSQLTFPDSGHTQTDLTVLCFTSSDSIVLTLLPFYSQPGAEFLKQHFYSCIFHIPFLTVHIYHVFLIYFLKGFHTEKYWLLNLTVSMEIFLLYNFFANNIFYTSSNFGILNSIEYRITRRDNFFWLHSSIEISLFRNNIGQRVGWKHHIWNCRWSHWFFFSYRTASSDVGFIGGGSHFLYFSRTA